MPTPDENLTPTQLCILQAVWTAGAEGATVAAIWDHLAQQREVARTTVLTQVQRLEKRGWLVRDDRDSIAVYRASIDQKRAEQLLARRFVTDFFAGSPTGLVKSLLGGSRIKKDELRELRKLIERAEHRR
ncbi:MAG: BlaI/MecI/CopY family transcriptional regulator [Planctomycetes bacterium]|nr:BlaI/MecI/CopY family transcriptional regulator [Planctomycetota bacterium]